MTIAGPSTATGMWLRGNLHAHTTESDGDHAPAELVDEYESRDYHFLAISDHNRLTDHDRSTVVLLPAVEVTANGSHLLQVGGSETVEPRGDRQAAIDELRGQDAIAVPAHPNWEDDFEHWPRVYLRELDGYGGVEIYNGNIERTPGAALATDRWDQLLSAGRRVWAFGTDDTHIGQDVANAWTVVRATERTPGAILDALREGRSYVSTGVTVTGWTVDGDEITVETRDADRLRFVSDYGRIQRTVDGTTATFDISADLDYGMDHTYVRIECLGRGGEMAWTQPFFLE